MRNLVIRPITVIVIIAFHCRPPPPPTPVLSPRNFVNIVIRVDRDGDEELTEDEFSGLPADGIGLVVLDENRHRTLRGSAGRRKEFRHLIDKNKNGKADRTELLVGVSSLRFVLYVIKGWLSQFSSFLLSLFLFILDVYRPTESKARDSRGPIFDHSIGYKFRREINYLGSFGQNGSLLMQ